MNYLLTLNDNKKRFFFLQLMKQLDFIEDIKEVKLSANQLKFINDFEESIKYMKIAEKVKRNFKTAQKLLKGSSITPDFPIQRDHLKKACFSYSDYPMGVSPVNPPCNLSRFRIKFSVYGRLPFFGSGPL